MALIQQFQRNWLGKRSGFTNIDICSCDICEIQFEQPTNNTQVRRAGKICNGRDLCKPCSKIECGKHIAFVGTKALSKLTPSERSINAQIGGKASALSEKENSSKFSTKRWNLLSIDDQQKQVKRANAGLHKKLEDPIFAAQHYAKIFAQAKIGYMSKAHKDLHSLIEHLGFESHVQIDRIQVDECNKELKIVVEYNGDVWHCNPRKWKADDYNSAIRMTAGEKWQKDIARRKFLESMGYTLILIWESGWIEDATKNINKIKEIYDEISKQEKHSV